MPLIEQPVAVSLKKILVATDFSPASEKASAWARALARRFSCEVELAHVFDPSVVTSHEEAIAGLPGKERWQQSMERLEHLRNSFSAAGINAQTTLPEGYRPFVALLRIAREHEIDLIVTETQSKSGAVRLILGSTAEELIRNAACPVLTIGPNAAVPPRNKPLVFRTIIHATDLSVEAARAAVYALYLAQDSGARLYFCYVSSLQGGPAEKTKILDGAFRAVLKKMVPESSYDYCNPEFVVEHGDAPKAILELAARVKADLIVLGARESSFWLTHIVHGLTPDLLAEAACPVMTVS
jgi:nucleotide-binding universal stress UspA family protein